MRKVQGFTLIELLVVIAIISLLAAILFPVFASARRKAQQAADLSNTKQISLALLQYEQDNDERVVLNDNAAGSPDRYGESGYGYFQDWEALLSPYVKSTGVWQCPGGSADSGDYWDPSFDLVDNANPPGGFISSLTLNNVYLDDTTLGGLFESNSSQGNTSMTSIEDPAEMIFCGDGGAGADTYSYGAANSFGGGGPEQLYYYPYQVTNAFAIFGDSMPPGGLHYYTAAQKQYPQLDSDYQGAFVGHFNNGANFAFFDGHSKFMQISTIAKVYPCPAGFSDAASQSQDMCASGGVLPYFTKQADTFLK